MKDKKKKLIIKKLKDREVLKIGYYKRLYPDTLTMTKGYFQIKLSYWIHKKAYEIVDCEFNIVAQEGKYFSLDSIDFYHHFDTEEELFEYISAFLDQFKSIKELYDHVYRKFKFIKPSKNTFGNDSIIDLYNLLKADLPDGTSLEDFVDQIRG